jgi:hypothetical protein
MQTIVQVRRSTPVDLTPIADLYHPEIQLVILDGIDDPVPALAKSIFFLSAQFFTAFRAGILSQSGYSVHDPLQFQARDGVQVFPDRFLEKYAIGDHWPSALSA